MEQVLIEKAVEYLAPVVMALLSWALAEVVRQVRKKTKNESINNAVSRVCAMTETTVAELSQCYVEQMRKKNGGRLSEEDKAALRAMAVDLVKKRLAPEVLSAAGKGVTDMRKFILARIERAVKEQKAAA